MENPILWLKLNIRIMKRNVSCAWLELEDSNCRDEERGRTGHGSAAAELLWIRALKFVLYCGWGDHARLISFLGSTYIQMTLFQANERFGICQDIQMYLLILHEGSATSY